jgi:hypothetical protein
MQRKEGKMGNVNVLIADHQNACAFFLKSVLGREGFGVSISLNADETVAKMGTGLFDIVVCDLDFSDDRSFSLIAGVNELLPGLPVVITTDWALKYPLRGLDVFSIVEKPLRIARIMEVMSRARRAVTALEDSRDFNRKDVNLPVEVIADGRRVMCRATNLSCGGVQLESIPTNGRVRKMLGLEPILKSRKETPLRTRIYFGNNRIEEFCTRLAYVERFRFASPEQVGLSFSGMSKGQKRTLETYLLEKE